jgi:tetratricopeptide (TPR) repeat protein
MKKEKLLEIIKSNDVEKIKSIKDYVEKHSNAKEKVGKDFYIISLQESLKTNDIEIEKALLDNLKFPLSYFLKNNIFTEFQDFYFKEITNKNGLVRLEVAKMCKYIFSPFLDYKENEVNKNKKLTFIKLLLNKIDKYFIEEEKLIEGQKPCVYKSLMLSLENIDSYIQKNCDYPIKEKVFMLLDIFYNIYFPEDILSDQESRYPNFSEDTGLSKKEDYYYTAMELLSAGQAFTAQRLLEQALIDYPDYLELYVGLAAVFKVTQDKKSFKEIVNKGYNKLLKQFPAWPKEMSWGLINNRQYLRIMGFKALNYYIEGDKNKAIELYKLILKLNPPDNQGVRYELAAIYAGINPNEIENMFAEGNAKQDWSKLEKMLIQQHKKHDFLPTKLIEDDEEDIEDIDIFTWKIN